MGRSRASELRSIGKIKYFREKLAQGQTNKGFLLCLLLAVVYYFIRM
jgi:hypothetical protein